MTTRMMIVTAPALLAIVLAASPAQAAYTGLSVQLHTSVTIGGQGYDVYRVYANFSDPGDRLVGVFGSPSLGATTIQTRNAGDTALGNVLYNTPGGVTAPSQSAIDASPERQWDTFATIGLSIVDQSPYGDFTFVTPGFVGIAGNNYTITNGGWFSIPTFDHDNNPSTPQIPPPQTLAGWTGDGDLPLRVMLMQLTVQAGENVRGTINIDIYPPMGGGGGQTVVHQPFQTFNSYTAPGPSVLALLGAAGFVRRGRRRT